LIWQATTGRAQPYLLTFTVMTPSPLFDLWVKGTAGVVDFFNVRRNRKPYTVNRKP
jgi:hypothetical protein